MAATTLAGAFAQGLHSARPAASSALEGYVYFETDTNGGTLFQCKSSAWVQLTTGVNAVSALGLTGSVAASRYVGATTGGAPVSGPHAVGDFSIDQTGPIWVCTVAGTPGTFVSASGAGVTSITGTANQIIASASTGAVTLSTPQAIATGSSPTFASLALGGLTGAVAGVRFVGSVASGAPASGTFLTNDLAYDIAGNKFWLCTAGGSPGTWVAGGGSGPQGKLGYAQITSAFTTSSTTFVDITGLTTTVTATSRSLKITVFARALSGTGGDVCTANIYDVTAGAQIQDGMCALDITNGQSPVCVVAVVTPGAGSRTYKAQLRSTGGQSVSTSSAATTPSFILVEEI